MNSSTKTVCGLIVSVLIGMAFMLRAQEDKPARRPVFRVEVENVFLRVAVSDSMGRYVTGLERENFRVFEDNVEQTISHFSRQDAPISVGIIFDVSASMKDNNNLRKAKNAIARFLKTEIPEDEAFLITFNQQTQMTQNFTEHIASLKNAMTTQKADGRTALYDAVYMGLDHIRRGKNEKKALILITDGEDNSSRYSSAEVRNFAKEADVQVYGIGEQGKLGYGYAEIQNIARLTGGRAFFPGNFNELDYYIDLIHAELRNQYVLGYSPINTTHDGKWRKLTVKLDAPPGIPKLAVRAKEGYYAPKN